MSASSAVGIHVEIGVEIEVEAAQRLLRPRAVGIGQHQVGAEAHETAHGIWFPREDGIIEIAAGDPAAAGRAQGPLGEADGLGALGFRHEIDAAHVVDGDAVEADVAARRIEAAGEGADHRNRPVGLRRIRVLADAGPAVAADRAALVQHPRHGADLIGADPADLGDALRRVAPAECAEFLQPGRAG